MIEIERSSTVVAEPDAVWAVVSTMAGVNAELAPFVRMTHPADRTSLDEQDVPLGEVLFASWLLGVRLAAGQRAASASAASSMWPRCW